ncbi:MAG: hypothetical protein LBG77_08985 [Dysgonamonadaceae bacterium]|nr:hypothetical protein [Dysgonamonadaceae bacterium]
MKRLIILSTAILSASTILAERNNFHNRTENWLKSVPEETTTAELRTAAPTADSSVPVGNALGLIIIAAGGYIVRIKNKQQKS